MMNSMRKIAAGMALAGWLGTGAFAADTLQFLGYLGGAQADSLAGVAIGPDGDFFVAGTTSSDDLPAAGRFQPTRAGGRDVFVARLKGSDRSLVWITYLGGGGDEDAADVAVDEQGNVTVAGITRSDDFPVSSNAFQDSRKGRADAFVARLSADGKTLQFATYLGGSQDDEASSLILDSAGKAVVAGTTRSEDLKVFAPLQATLGGGTDVFLARLSPDGRSADFVTYFGGNRDDRPFDLAWTAEGHLLVTGSTASDQNFPLFNPLQESRSGGSDAFVAQLGPEGHSLALSTYLGGRGGETGYCVVSTPAGELIVAGETSSDDLALVDPVQHNYVGGGDLFVMRITADGSSVDFATYLGGVGNDSLRDCYLDAFGRLAAVGLTTSPDFPVVGGFQPKSAGQSDLFFAVIDPRRATLDFSSPLGGAMVEIPAGMALTGDGTLLVAGVTASTDLPAFGGPAESFPGGGIYGSDQAGANWRPVAPALDPNVEAVAVHPANSWVYVGTTSSGVFRSRDRGQTWEALGPAGVRVLAIGLDPSDPEVVFAGGATGIWRTRDGGQTWELLGQPRAEGEDPSLPQTPYSTIAVNPEDPQVVYAGTLGQGVFKSTDGGDTWTAASDGLSGGALTIYRLVFHPQKRQVLFAGTKGSLVKTEDGGRNWAETSLKNVGEVRGIAFDRTNPQTVYASGVFGGNVGPSVAKSSDGGQNWSVQPNPPGGGLTSVITDLRAHPTNSQILVMATAADGILRSSNGGETWQAVTGLGTNSVLALAVDPRQPNFWYAGYQSVSAGLLAAVKPRNVFYFPQVADGVFDRIAFRTAFALVNTGPATTATLEFFTSAGEPMELALEDHSAASQIQVELPAGGGFYATTPGTDPGLRVGYARVTAGPGVDGTAIFTRMDREANVTLYEAGVPATRALGDFAFLLDSLGDTNTGVALVNVAEGLPGKPDPAPLRLRLIDGEGNIIAEQALELARGQHAARFVDEIFSSARPQVLEMRGMVAVEAPVPVVALTLRQRDRVDLEFPDEVATLTPFPVIQPLNRGRTAYFPQIADGLFGISQTEAFRTSFFLANPPSSIAVNRVFLDFFKSDGKGMGLDIGEDRPVGRVVADLPPGGFQVVESKGAGPLQVGYARAAAGAPFLGATAVWSLQDLTFGIPVFEAGVAAVFPQRRFSILVDSLGPWDTGLALVKTGAAPATVRLRLYDLDRNLLAEETQEVPAAHLPRFVRELFPKLADAREMRGVLTVESDQPLAAVTLRQRAGNAFPTDVSTLTTFPVIPGIPPE